MCYHPVPLLRSVALPAALPLTSLPSFFTTTISAAAPAGRYVMFVGLVRPGESSDGPVDLADLLGLATRSFAIVP